MALEIRSTDRDGNVRKILANANPGSLTLSLTDPARFDLGVPMSDVADLIGDNREVQVWREGETAPRMVGIPWTADKNSGARAMSIPVLGLESVLAHRILDTTQTFTGVEQFDIAWNLIAYTQGLAGGDLNLSAAAWTASGVTRDATYDASERTPVLEALESFRSRSNGFDWSIEPVAADRREWTPYYPARGTFHPEWAVGYGRGTRGNAADYGARLDRRRVTRKHHALGSGDGPDRLIGVYADPALGPTVDLLETVSAESSSIVDVATLVEHATAHVAARSAPFVTVLTEVEVSGPRALVDGIRPGDTIPVRVRDGGLDIDGTYRVAACTWPPSWDRVTLTLEE